MAPSKTRINPILDELIININLCFIELLAANMMHDLGRYSIETIDDQAVISPKVGFELHIEPIPIRYIKIFKDNFPYFILEVFHGKFVLLWHDLLSNIFSIYIELHFSNIRKFEELKKQEIRLDFNSPDNFNVQIKNGIIDDFNFKEFSERQKLINKLLNPEGDGQEALVCILKNILLRNIIQHRKNVIDDYILRKLGRDHIEILDNDGKIINYSVGDNFKLSIPEIYAFKKSILNIAQIWRIING